MRSEIATLACLALALCACKGEQKKATGGTAQGEILPGSASDAMLPFDTVKSQAPLAPRSEGADKGDTPDGAKKDQSSGEAVETGGGVQPTSEAGKVPAPAKSGDQ